MNITIETLPDDLLVRIGTSVVDCCGAVDFVRLAQTSKRIYRTLMDKDVIRNILESENERIFTRAYTTNSLFTKASTLEEMAFCQRLAQAKKTGALTPEDNRGEEDLITTKNLNFFRDILMRYPLARMIVNLNIPPDFTELVYETIAKTISAIITPRIEKQEIDRMWFCFRRADDMCDCEFSLRFGETELPPLPQVYADASIFREEPLGNFDAPESTL